MKLSALVTGLFLACLNLLLLLCPLLFLSPVTFSSLPVSVWSCLGLLTLWSLLESGLQSFHRSNVSSAEGSLPWMQGLLLYSLLVLGLLESTASVQWKQWQLGGGLLLSSGILLRLLAISTLQQWFLDGVRLEQQHPLITTGIYRSLRHPSETGNLCILFGSAWLLGTAWMGLGVLLLWCPLTLWRLQQEEELLRVRFQEDFQHYQQTSGLLWPRWR